MSEQHVKCKMEGNCTEFTTEENCNPGCEFYNPVDEHIPENVQKQIDTEVKPILQFSNLAKFDKAHEFVVLKKHIFQLQSVSPKKIILKFKRKLNEKDKLPDGCYIFKNPETNKALEQVKVFGIFAKNVRDARKTKDKAIRDARKTKDKAIRDEKEKIKAELGKK